MIKVAVLGSRGRMGSEVVKAVTEAKDLELVAELDLGDSLDTLVTAGAQWWGEMAFAAIAGDVRPATFDAPRENLWRGDATD